MSLYHGENRPVVRATPPGIFTVPYQTTKSLIEPIENNKVEIEEGRTTTQFIKVTGVPRKVFEQFDEKHLGGRLTYDFDTKDLGIRLIPSMSHERAHASLMTHITLKLFEAGVPVKDVDHVQAARITGRSTSKEGDSSMRPLPQRGVENPPTVVIESGLSESRPPLRNDARWWLTNVQPPVNIVILIALSKTARTIELEVWMMVQQAPPAPAPARRLTRSQRPNPPQPQAVSEIKLTPVDQKKKDNKYQASAELRLDFASIMPRNLPVSGPSEIVFTKQDLADWAEFIFNEIPRS